MQSRSGRPAKCFKRFHQALMWSLAGCFDASGSFVQCACQLPLLHLGMCVLEELHLFGRLVVVCLIGVEKQLSAPQVPWLRLRQPRVLRRKRARCFSQLPENFAVYVGGERIAHCLPLHNVGMFQDGKAILPHKIGEYMQLVLRCVLSMSASRGVPANALVLGNNASVGSLVTATHLKESRPGPGFILHVDDF